MKQMKCLDCDKTFQAETSDEMLQTMMPHYMSDHKEMMEKGGSDEEKKAWFARFHKEWEKAEEK